MRHTVKKPPTPTPATRRNPALPRNWIPVAALLFLLITVACGAETPPDRPPPAPDPAALAAEVERKVQATMTAATRTTEESDAAEPEPAEPEPALEPPMEPAIEPADLNPPAATPVPALPIDEPEPVNLPAPGTPDRRATDQPPSLVCSADLDSCRAITPNELGNIRRISIELPQLANHQFDAMENLERLEISGVTQTINAGTFSSFPALRELQVSTDPVAGRSPAMLQDGAFAGLGGLEYLQLNANPQGPILILDQHTLDGLEDLSRLDVEGNVQLQRTGLKRLQELRELRIYALPNPNREPKLPPEFLVGQTGLETVTLHNLRWPAVLKLANQNMICKAQHWQRYLGEGNPAPPFSVEVIGEPGNYDFTEAATQAWLAENCPATP